MPATELAALLIFATAMSFTPGANTTLAAALGANHGLRHAMRFVLAVPFGWGLLLLACGPAQRRSLGTAQGARLVVFNRLMAAVLVATALWMAWL